MRIVVPVDGENPAISLDDHGTERTLQLHRAPKVGGSVASPENVVTSAVAPKGLTELPRPLDGAIRNPALGCALPSVESE